MQLRVWTFLLAATFITTAAHAVVISGHVVLNDPTPGDASAVPSASLPSADFITSGIDFETNSSPSTSIADFLNNPVFTNLQNGFDPTSETNNTFIELTGSTFLNAGSNSFVVGHDDGVVLTFADPSIGTVVNAPGPTGFSNSPFTVSVATAGFYDFDLKYAECCGGPADLLFSVNRAPVGTTAVPEPASLAILGAGLSGIAVARRRRRAG